MSATGAPLAAPLWFGPPDRPLFGWLHTPADGLAFGAVVLCPPLTREWASVHDSYRRLAEDLAERGLVAVRFDYDGTGDSAGSGQDPGRVEAWLHSIDHAIALARSTGAHRVGLVGMRMGALLAATSSRRSAGLDALVLWDPCWSGRTFVREQRAISLLRFGVDGRAADAGELPGFRLDAQTVADVAALRLPTDGVAAAQGALVLSRPGLTPPPRARADLSSAGVAWDTASEDSGLLDAEPFRLEAVRRIAGWLSQALAGPSQPVDTGAAEQADSTVMEVGGHRIIERCRRLGPLGLVGIETAPAPSAGGPVVVMANAGADWHAGTNRLWVHLARRLAAAGLRSVRFDVSGLGDSPAHPGQRAQLVYAPEAVDDMVEVAAAVSPDDPADVVLVGLCSGAYLSLEGALRLQARGLCALNPVLRFTPPEMARGPMDPRRRICRPASRLVRAYRNVPEPLRRQVQAVAWWAVARLNPAGAHGHQAGDLAGADLVDGARRTQSARSVLVGSLPLATFRTGLGRAASRAAGLLGGPSSPVRWLEELVVAGVDVCAIGGERELRPLLEGERRARSPLAASGRCRLELMPGLDHSLLFSPQREELTAMVVEHLVDRFAPDAPSRPRVARPAPALGPFAVASPTPVVPAATAPGGRQ